MKNLPNNTSKHFTKNDNLKDLPLADVKPPIFEEPVRFYKPPYYSKEDLPSDCFSHPPEPVPSPASFSTFSDVPREYQEQKLKKDAKKRFHARTESKNSRILSASHPKESKYLSKKDNSIYKKLLTNTKSLFIGQMSSKLLVYIMMPLYTRWLATDGFGNVSNIVNVSALLMGLVTLCIAESVHRYALKDSYRKSQVFTTGLAVTLLGNIFFLPFSFLLEFLDPMFKNYTLLIFFYVLTGSVRLCCAMFTRASGKIKTFAADGVLTTIINIALNFLLVGHFKLYINGYIISVILADLCSILFLLFFGGCFSKIKVRLWSFPRSILPEMLRYCAPLVPTAALWWIMNVSDGFFIKHMISENHNGIYQAAYKFPALISIISGIASQAFNLSAVEAWKKNAKDRNIFFSNMFSVYSSCFFLGATALFVAIRMLSDLMTGAGFETAYRYTPFLIISAIFSCLVSVIGNIYSAAEKTMNSMLTALMGAAINIFLNMLLIPNPKFGMQGAAFATMVSLLLILIIRLIDCRKDIKISIRFKRTFVNLLLSGACAYVIINIQAPISLYYWLLGAIFVASAFVNLPVLSKFVRDKL